MSKYPDTSNPVPDRNSPTGINRREMVRRLMLAGGAGLAIPAIAEGYPDNQRAAEHTAHRETSSSPAEAGQSPKFLDPHQFQTLGVLAERIIPGSGKAEVSSFIDLLLSVDNQEAQKKFLESLSAFEAESLRRFSHPYIDLTEAPQNEILTLASTTEPGSASKDQPVQLTMRDHFENLKGWISGAYYSSEIGMKSLGWTGQVYFTSFPGCQKPATKQS